MSVPTAGAVLSSDAIAAYRRDGYLLLPGHLPEPTMAELRGAMPGILAVDSPRRIFERDGTTVRSVYGPHLASTAVAGICRMPRLAGAAVDLIGDSVYIHQSKINVKAAFSGDQWEWHQDYVYWLRDDGIREPKLVNVTVFIDEVTEFNGPLTVIPGSHLHDVLAISEEHGMPEGYQNAPEWVSTLTATEKYGVRRDIIERLARSNGLASPKGPAGSVLFFHPNILHASSPNISPFRRAVLIVVYNNVSNPATNTASPRPEFLAARDTTPVALSGAASGSGRPRPN